ncbi:hypothetical protein ES708_24105 [subsurface metagenome]
MKIGRSKARAISEITIDQSIDMLGFSLTNMGNLVLPANAGVQLLANLPANNDFSGETVLAVAGENIAQWEVVYLNADGTVYRSDASAAGTMPIKGIAVAAVAAAASGVFLIEGFYRTDGHGFTVGEFLYASGAIGEITETAPAVSGDQVQRVGLAVNANVIWFRPDLTTLEVA